MAKKQFNRILRPATAEERQRHGEIRRKVMQEFPPAESSKRPESPTEWRVQLEKLVRARGTDQFPLLVFELSPPSGKPWPESLPACQGLQDFYAICDGGLLSSQYNWLSLTNIAEETARWRAMLHNYRGDDEDILASGRHLVLAHDSAGAPVIWDAKADRLASFFWKGGDWEPYNLGFEEFMTALFLDPSRVSAGGEAGALWVKAIRQLDDLL